MLEGIERSSYSPNHRESLTRFILFWGEMASRWGINRTMAQIHALLYASEEAMDTDEIMKLLQISRGNANMNLRSLINWDLVKKIHLAGSRKDFYQAEKDVWKITARIVTERQKREVKPIQEELQHCLHILSCSNESEERRLLSEEEQQYYVRIDNLVELLKVFESFFDAIFPLLQQYSVDETKQFVEFARQFSDNVKAD